MKTLRARGGDSAYVPTTTIRSATDNVILPETGTAASGYILDARGVGVRNNEFQALCPLQPAGSVYAHEGTLYDPVGWALAVDALTRDGPADASRLDLTSLCQGLVAEGLSLQDVVADGEYLGADSV